MTVERKHPQKARNNIPQSWMSENINESDAEGRGREIWRMCVYYLLTEWLIDWPVAEPRDEPLARRWNKYEWG